MSAKAEDEWTTVSRPRIKCSPKVSIFLSRGLLSWPSYYCDEKFLGKCGLNANGEKKGCQWALEYLDRKYQVNASVIQISPDGKSIRIPGLVQISEGQITNLKKP